MSRIEFMIGRVSSRLEEALLSKIAALASDPLESVTVIVPPQATYSTELAIIEKLEAGGIMGVSVVSFTKLAQRILSEVRGLGTLPIDSAGQSIIMRLILDNNAQRLTALKSSAASAELAASLADLAGELKSHDVTPDMLRTLDVGEQTRRKLGDIAFMLEQFERETSGFATHADSINHAIKSIPDAPFIRNTHVIIHGFDMFDAQTVRYIKQLMLTARSVTVSFLHAHVSDPDAEVYRLCEHNREKFIADALPLGLETTIVEAPRENFSKDILHLERNLYAYPFQTKAGAKDISITRAADMEREVRAVAAQVAYLVGERGMSFSDIGLVCGDMQSYEPVVRKVFGKANIPVYGSAKRPLLSSAAATFVLTAMEISYGTVHKDTVIEHAKTGYCNIAYEQACTLQDYAYRHIKSGFAFLSSFSDEKAEDARRALIEPLTKLRESAKSGRAADVINAVVAYTESLDLSGKVATHANDMRAAGLLAEAEFTDTACEQVLGELRQAGQILAGSDIPPAQLVRLMRTGLQARQIATIPPAADEIAAGDISYVRLPGVKMLFVLGANEGVLPDYSQTADILTAAERDLILKQLAGLKYGGAVEKQKLAILRALGGPSKKLFLSYHTGGGSQPSPLLSRIKELFGDMRINEADTFSPRLYENAAPLGAQAIRKAASGAELTARERAFADMIEDAGDRQVMRAARAGNSAARLLPATATGLFGEITGSASRVETFYNCPYRHYVAYGLRPDLPREHTIDQLDVGQYAHRLLDDVTRKANGFDTLTDDQLENLVRESAAQARQSHDKYRLGGGNEAVLRAVENETTHALRAIRRQAQASIMRPTAAEREFRTDLGGVTLHGFIDRLDVARLGNETYFNIIDYKTGAAGFDIGKAYGGIGLQLLIYIIAAQRLLENGKFAGALYFHVGLPPFTEDTDEDAAYRMNGIVGIPADKALELYGDRPGGVFGIGVRLTRDGAYHAADAGKTFTEDEMGVLTGFVEKLVREAASRISSGDNAIAPAKSGEETACRYCDYKSVCMFDDGFVGNETRVIEKLGKNEALTRMEDGL